MEKVNKEEQYGVLRPVSLNENYQSFDTDPPGKYNRRNKPSPVSSSIDYPAIDAYFAKNKNLSTLKSEDVTSPYAPEDPTIKFKNESNSLGKYNPYNSNLTNEETNLGASSFSKVNAPSTPVAGTPNTAFGAKFGSGNNRFGNVGVADTSPIGDYSDGDGDGGSGIGSAAGIAGAVVSEAPKVIAAFQGDPQSDKEATGRVLQTTASGAAIGTAIMPGWGTAIGAAAGLIGGLIGTAGKVKKAKRDNRLEENARMAAIQSSNEEERKKLYLEKANAKTIEAQRNLFLESQGYSV